MQRELVLYILLKMFIEDNNNDYIYSKYTEHIYEELNAP